jgi:hypothetical protein
MEMHEPPGWRELRAQLATETDPVKIKAIFEKLDRLLAAYEKAHPENDKKTTLKPKAEKSPRTSARCPQSRKKAPKGKEAKLSYNGNLLVENLNG